MYERLLDPVVLRAARGRVHGNGGSAGIDQVTCEDFEQDLDQNLITILQEMKSGKYSPLPAVRFYTRKPGGKRRAGKFPALCMVLRAASRARN